MKYRGKEIDPIALWSNYVDFPANLDESGPFLPLVQCPNPDHVTTKRHFQINVEQPTVHCFTYCGISGSYENAIMMIEGCKRADARKAILRHRRAGISAKPKTTAKRDGESIPAALDLASFTYLPQAGLEYLKSRSISEKSIARWELGWNPESLRITIPGRDMHGRVCFVIERAVKSNQFPKYLYSEGSDKSSLLFGACNLDLEKVRSWGIIVVEGSLDAIRIDQHGIGPVVAILGSHISGKQTEILASLRPKRVFSMFDLDAAGIHATFSLRKAFRRSPVFVCRYPRGFSDPAELSRKEAERVIQKAIPYSMFQARATRLMKGA